MSNKAIFVVESQYNLEGHSVIAYPHTAMSFDVELPIFKGLNRQVVRTYATVDMIKNTAILADSVPDLIKVELDEQSILPTIIKTDDAVEVARIKVVRWAMRRFRLISLPNVKLIEEVSIYHPFVLKEVKGKTVMVNIVRNTKEIWEG